MNLPRPFFVLAPMDDVTDTVFRQMIATTAAPDLYFTEFVNVDGLQSPGRPKLLPKLVATASEKPLIVQLWGKTPGNYYKCAREIANGTFALEIAAMYPNIKENEINFAGIDINMGCPAKPVVQNGCCSALINNRELASEIIIAVQQGSAEGLKEAGRGDEVGDFPVSVKTRLGWNEIDFSWHEHLLSHKLNMLTIHGRTRKEMSKVPNHWDAIGHIARLRTSLSPDTKIIGNGDIVTRDQGLQLAEDYGLDGLMIGRGVFHDPYVFAESSPWGNMTPQQKIDLYTSHVKLFAETWKNQERNIVTLNKFCKVYIEGFPGAKEFRERLMDAESIENLLSMLESSSIS
ncbi:MAG: tRNA-dihydrouridine synthase [Candidatus Saccharibacteria bacterium]|nr:tRNA-dihydrouridine synthase [Candidatus Saccharibacteria bacterium]